MNYPTTVYADQRQNRSDVLMDQSGGLSCITALTGVSERRQDMSEFDLDVSDLTRFGDDLVAAADGLLEKVKPVVAKGALNVKTQMVKDMKASTHFKQVARTIGYDDIEIVDGGVEADVGPATEGKVVGDLAHIAYFGGAHGGGATVPDPQTALDDEAPKFEEALGKIIDELP